MVEYTKKSIESKKNYPVKLFTVKSGRVKKYGDIKPTKKGDSFYLIIDLEGQIRTGTFGTEEELRKLVKDVPEGTLLSNIQLSVSRSGYVNLEKFDIESGDNPDSVFTTLCYCPKCGERIVKFKGEEI